MASSTDTAMINYPFHIPRYPFFVRPTFQNWFRTTVNPLVWSLLPNPPTRVDAIAGAALRREGLYIDWDWCSPVCREGAELSLEERAEHRPDNLFDQSFCQEVFDLLTTGRREDREAARRVLCKLCMPYNGGASILAPAPDDGAIVMAAHPAKEREGREQLCKALTLQRAIWSHMKPGASAGSVVQKVMGIIGLSDTQIRKHIRVRGEYESLIDSCAAIHEAADRIYGAKKDVALLTLTAAVEWLGGGAEGVPPKPQP